MQVGTYPTRNFALAVTDQASFAHEQPGRDREPRPGGPDISAGLCMSPCSTDYLFLSHSTEARRIVSEGSTSHEATSLLIVRTGRIVTARGSGRVAPDTRSFQHTAGEGSLNEP